MILEVRGHSDGRADRVCGMSGVRATGGTRGSDHEHCRRTVKGLPPVRWMTSAGLRMTQLLVDRGIDVNQE